MRTNRSRLLAVATAAVFVLASCGGDDGGDDTGSDAGSDETATPAATDAPDDDGSTDEPAATEAPSDDGSDVDTSGGTCETELTGDLNTSWTSGGGMMALNTDYWLGEAEKEMFGDAFYFIINCQGDEGYLGITAGQAANTDTVPYGPGTYTLNPGGALGGNQDDPLSVMLTTGEDTFWAVSEPGTVEITEWDDDHIAGTVTFTAEESFGGTGTVQVSATFDLDNPNP